MKNSLLKSAKELIEAWEVLPGDKRYTPKEIQSWLLDHMKPAIDDLKDKIKEVKEKS